MLYTCEAIHDFITNEGLDNPAPNWVSDYNPVDDVYYVYKRGTSLMRLYTRVVF